MRRKVSWDNGVWCKGSTQDFDSCRLGSNPNTPVMENRKFQKSDMKLKDV